MGDALLLWSPAKMEPRPASHPVYDALAVQRGGTLKATELLFAKGGCAPWI